MKRSNLPKIIGFGVVLAISIIGLSYVYSRLNSFDDEFQRIKHADDKVIESLTRIRYAEKAYLSVNGRYTDDFDTLADFLANGHFFLTSKTEIIHTIRPGVDSIETLIDTLDMIPVYDSLRNNLNLRKSELPRIGDLPDEDGQFEIYANARGGQYFIEVVDPLPVNPRRKENAPEEIALKPLKFGSKASPSTKGNWE